MLSNRPLGLKWLARREPGNIQKTASVMEILRPFETTALEMILSGAERPLPLLRHQLSCSSICDRQHSKWGEIVTFSVSPGETPCEPENFVLSDVALHFVGIAFAVRVLLHVEKGFIHRLQLRTVDEHWPPTPGWSQPHLCGSSILARTRRPFLLSRKDTLQPWRIFFPAARARSVDHSGERRPSQR